MILLLHSGQLIDYTALSFRVPPKSLRFFPLYPLLQAPEQPIQL